MNLIKQQQGVLRVEFGNSMPFFKEYAVKVDGVETKTTISPIVWQLRPGRNRLEVTPVSLYGKRGNRASVELEFVDLN